MVGIYVTRENQIINKYLEKNQLLLRLNHAHLSIYTRRKPKSSYLYNESLVYIQNITKPKFSLDIYHKEILTYQIVEECLVHIQNLKRTQNSRSIHTCVTCYSRLQTVVGTLKRTTELGVRMRIEVAQERICIVVCEGVQKRESGGKSQQLEFRIGLLFLNLKT